MQVFGHLAVVFSGADACLLESPPELVIAFLAFLHLNLQIIEFPLPLLWTVDDLATILFKKKGLPRLTEQSLLSLFLSIWSKAGKIYLKFFIRASSETRTRASYLESRQSTN